MNSYLLPTFKPKPASAGIGAVLKRLVESASGYDQRLLEEYGSENDRRRAKTIGRLVLIVALVTGYNWWKKEYASSTGLATLFMPFFMGMVACAIVLVVESFLGAEIDPCAPLGQRVRVWCVRLSIALFEAIAAATPNVLQHFESETSIELARLQSETRLEFQRKATATHSLASITAERDGARGEMGAAIDALRILPETLVDAQQMATASRAAYERARVKAEGEARSLMLEFKGLDATITNSKDAKEVNRAEGRKAWIRSHIDRLAADVQGQKAASERQQADFERDKLAYISEASQKKQAAEERLSQQELRLTNATTAAERDNTLTANLLQKSVTRSSGYEYAALLRVLAQPHAAIVAAFIFFSYLILAAAPITMRSFLTPGPYDENRRLILARRTNAARSQYLAEKVHHEEFQAEVESKSAREEIRNRAKKDIADGRFRPSAGEWFASGGPRAASA